MKICKEMGCGRKHKSLGLCDIHYKRLWRHGDTETHRTGWHHSPVTIARMSAAALGKPKSLEARRKMSAAKRGKPTWNKGIKAGPLSDATRAKLRGKKSWNAGLKGWTLGYWLGKKRGPHSAETKAKMSQAHFGKPKSAEHVRNILASRWHGKRPEYAGISFRSSYEVRLAKAFDSHGIRWEYEPTRFNLGTCSYLPDFYLPDLKTYWEAKGYFAPESQRKVGLFRTLHPDKPLIVATKNVIKMMEVSNGSGHMEDGLTSSLNGENSGKPNLTA